MTESLPAVGAGGLLALLIIREVFRFIRIFVQNKKECGPTNNPGHTNKIPGAMYREFVTKEDFKSWHDDLIDRLERLEDIILKHLNLRGNSK